MSEAIKISMVSYLNSLPFKYGIENSEDLKNEILVIYNNPAKCANLLNNNKVDIGLIPIIAIDKYTNLNIINDFCIAAKKKVKSVLLLSNQPLNKIKRIKLDYQSLTSTSLLKILIKYYWKNKYELLDTRHGYEKNINIEEAAVIIGDRALMMQNKFEYVIDLAEEWYKFTNLPAVFALWASNKKIEKVFLKKFNQSLKYGIDNIDKVIKKMDNCQHNINLSDYLLNCIDYKIDSKKIESIKLFKKYYKEL